jgi:hypothetical protein
VFNVARYFGRKLANFLNKPLRRYPHRVHHEEPALREILRPGDVILIEGDRRISSAIKYLTQSTWSHACMYVGDAMRTNGDACTTWQVCQLQHPHLPGAWPQ